MIRILYKEEALTEKEFDRIKQHVLYGADIVEELPGFDDVLDGVKYHHEHWDGSGYPEGRSGEDIPLFGRIIAVADAFDAITTERPYSGPMSIPKALEIIEESKGSQFAPREAEIFLETVDPGIIEKQI